MSILRRRRRYFISSPFIHSNLNIFSSVVLVYHVWIIGGVNKGSMELQWWQKFALGKVSQRLVSDLAFWVLESIGLACFSPCAHDKACSPVLPKQDPSFDADLSRTGTGEGSISHRGRTSVEPSKDPALDASDEANSLPVPLDDQSSFISTSGVVQRSRQQNFFTPKQISSAIDASEKTRLLCSAIVAVLVLLLHFGFSLLGNRFLGTIISFRPLYFILLTDVTLVILRLLFADGGSSQRAIGEVNKAASTDDYSWAEQLSNTLEVGLVAQKVIDAVFMDCSVYAIIVICGLSFT
ncbi:uncharacterized protein LOC111300427 isoform X1 [Durio zibethinus]|uniref:Uncharacterized protein LOC111300427 isoform X1 n=1 Tax=Durio zibethinus TaxID=66656 RepID=A0A6P5ZGY4_DURZI|nr:uncharacterized protein LOC111300427 isoform X1 [Durio zibethinus]